MGIKYSIVDGSEKMNIAYEANPGFPGQQTGAVCHRTL